MQDNDRIEFRNGAYCKGCEAILSSDLFPPLLEFIRCSKHGCQPVTQVNAVEDGELIAEYPLEYIERLRDDLPTM